jgi:hypothetical protein
VKPQPQLRTVSRKVVVKTSQHPRQWRQVVSEPAYGFGEICCACELAHLDYFAIPSALRLALSKGEVKIYVN